MIIFWLVAIVALIAVEAGTVGLVSIWFAIGATAALIAAAFIGVICPVTEDIDNIAGTGVVSVDGKEWTARSLTGVNIPAGQYVRVTSIQGVKLIVEEATVPA